MHNLNNHYDKVLTSLWELKAINKYVPLHPEVFLYGKSAYVFGQNINCRVEFLERRFETIAKIPFGEDFESSDDIEDNSLSDRIVEVNEKCRAFCDTLFYINKYELLNFINSNYGSVAKLNKIRVTIELDDGVRFKFEPVKKSTSVFPCEYRIDTSAQIHPTFRIEFGKISISALLLQKVLDNKLLGKNARVEISTRRGFLRASSINESIFTNYP